MALEAAFGCGSKEQLAEVTTVFASRHGDAVSNVPLLESLARNEPLSPTRFSHSVHNAPAALFSIAAKNRRPSTSVAAARGTFASGYLEAITMLYRGRGCPVLFVVADQPLPPPFDGFQDEPSGAYAVALLLVAGDGVDFRPSRPREEAPRREWPDAVEFLRWWRLGSPSVTLAGTASTWTWSRAPTRTSPHQPGKEVR
jgi:hypothetical protein